ncbi:sulfurtransferase [Falsirhodobacter halotolerans]|uniref:sulfurtransferase n=1 Tax=Falsirhodobacter halotolerans TaxID=1146892 RepID=UPI001FD0C39E|nr:rhodanese-like domain-containing protein [Falsirhodobacter halotolerans]MCJ8139003.1 sulfurtransferase [Falsirhodobacter halotolerans]
MKTTLLATLALLGTTGLAVADIGPLVTPADLAAEGSAPLILDIRETGYEAGHVPGAIPAPYGLFRGPAENPGALVPEEELESRLRALGVTLDRPVVVVHQGKDDSDFGAAARVYWTLKSSGVSQLAILNGGMNAWRDAGQPVQTEGVAPTPSTVDVTFSDQWLATRDEVDAIVAGDRTAHLIDARPTPFFDGAQAHPAAAKPGTLPLAQSVPHSGFFDGTPRLAGADTARDVAAEAGIGQGDEVVSFCNTGHWAATEWFALSEVAGLPNVKLYPESMVGYSQTGGAMQNEPSLWDNLVRQVRGSNG